MTRINLVPPEILHRKHLVAEYRELPRVFSLARLSAEIPPAYTLGKGHVTFFYNKLGFLAKRFELIVAEMLRRGYKPAIPADAMWHKSEMAGGTVPAMLYGSYQPTPEAIALNVERIKQRQPKE